MAGSDDRVALLEASANSREPDSLRSNIPTLLSGLQEFQTKSSERPTGFHGETFNSPSAHGQHTNNGVEEEMPEPGRRHMRGKRSVAQTGGKPPQEKRQRAQNWADDEKTSLLMDKLGFFVIDILRPLGLSTFKYGKSWAYYVSETDSGEIMPYQNSTDLVGVVPPQELVHSLYGINEHRRHTDCDKVNADTKPKGEPAAAQAMELRTVLLNLVEDGKTTTALEVLRMAGIAKPFELHEFEPARKRIRTRVWSAEEIRTMLETVDEALRADLGPNIWGFVSDTLWENYGFDRASNSCEDQWATLVLSHKATRDQGDTRGSTGFELEFGETIERILPRLPLKGSRIVQMEMSLGLSPSAPPLFQFQSSASETGFSDSADCEEDLSEEEMEDVDTHSDDEGLSGDSTATIESQAEVSHVSRATEPWDESNSNYDRKRSAPRVVEEDLISRIAPFVNRQIEDALKPLLSVLRRREEEQQNHREKLLALKQEKLALKREKMHFARRV